MVVGLGLANRDVVAVVPSWERDEKVVASALFEQTGGPVPVALHAIARLGSPLPLHFLGVLGNDRDGEEICRDLQASNIETGSCIQAPGVTTSKSLVFLDDRDGTRTLANYAEKLPPLVLSTKHEALLRRARLLHTDGRDLPAALRAAWLVNAAGGTVSLDLGTMRPRRMELVDQCEIVIASRKGGAGAFRDAADDPTEQVRRLLESGPRIAGVTLGPDGVVIGVRGGGIRHLPAYPVAHVRDTCGAGDTFHGAFLWAYLAGQGVFEAADFAQAAAALRIGSMGNQAGLPTHEQVHAFQTRRAG